MAKLSPRRRFWLLTTAALLVAALTFSLGQWQLRRAAQKQALMLAIESQSNESILKASDLASFKNLQEVVHRRATLKGIWKQPGMTSRSTSCSGTTWMSARR